MRKPLKDALDRIALLEARIAALEARPQVIYMSGLVTSPVLPGVFPQPSYWPPSLPYAEPWKVGDIVCASGAIGMAPHHTIGIN